MLERFRNKLTKNQSFTMTLVFLLMFLISMAASPHFRTMKNVMNLLSQNAIFGVMALGMSCCIVVGFIDLSAGAILALAGVIGAAVVRDIGFGPGVLITLAVGTAIGIVNGVLIAKFKIGYFITTLGMTSICRGAVYIITNGNPVSGVPSKYNFIGMGRIGGIPICAVIWFASALILGLVIYFTRLGRYMYAVGGNERASWLSGVDTDLIKITAFALNGFFCAMGSLLLMFRVLMISADAGTGYEMTAIASCVVGGLSLLGGKGNVFNAVIGTLIMGLILNILQLLGVSSYWQEAITGVVILVAAGIDVFLNRLKD